MKKSEYSLKLILTCTSDEPWVNWECNTECEIAMKSFSRTNSSISLPDTKWDVKLTKENPSIEFGKFPWFSYWYSSYVSNEEFTICVTFKYVEVSRPIT